MFGLFNKKEKLQSFASLRTSKVKDKYFYRVTQWDWLNEQSIKVMDNHSPRIIKMDGWLQLVYLEANGKQTVTEFVLKMASMYNEKEKMPENLDAMILEHLQSLQSDKLIDFSSRKSSLPYYIDLPKSQQDEAYALKLMKVDGFVKE